MIPPPGTPDRLAWQWRIATRPILNVGCESDPARLGSLPDTVNVDIDLWENVANFRQADARALPFDDLSFGTVLLCECLDHMETPEKAIVEAVRVARHTVAITLPADDGAHESPDHWKDHVQFLHALGLVETAPGDLALRHGHHRHWKREDVFDLMKKAKLAWEAQGRAPWSREILYEPEGANPPEWRIIITP